MKEKIPCKSCRWCITCTQGINFPTVFKLWNRYCESGDGAGFRKSYYELEKRPESCIRCRQCGILCPQRINIPNKLGEMAEEIQKIENNV